MINQKGNNIIYQPSLNCIEKTNIYDFCNQFQKFIQKPIKNDYFSLHQASIKYNQEFWSFFWDYAKIIGKKGKVVIEEPNDFINSKFFPDSKLNIAKNILYNQIRNQQSIVFESEDKITRTFSSQDLINHSLSVAKYLQSIGIKQGDIVAAYLPNIPETIIAAIATFSIGACFTSASPDFGAEGIIDRFGQTKPKVIFIADGCYYNSKKINLIEKSLGFLKHITSIKKVIVVDNTKTSYNLKPITSKSYQVIEYDKLISRQNLQDYNFIDFDFNNPIYILYSSGTTGKPKCIIHSSGGALLQHKKEHLLHCDIKPKDRVFYFTTCGWMMWNWLISSLASQATVMLYDGSPFAKRSSILWDYCEKNQVTFFGTSAKYLAELQARKYAPKNYHKLTKLKTIASTGSCLLPEQFDFVYKHIKPIIHLASISGGTDIVSCFVLGSPNLPVRRGEIQSAGLGMEVAVLDPNGKQIALQKGELTCLKTFPAKPLGFFGDSSNQKFKDTYFSKYPNIWCHGDYIELTKNFGYIIYGRSDTTLNPSGIRIGTAEIYRVLAKITQIESMIAVDYPYNNDNVIIIFVKLIKKGGLDQALIQEIKLKLKTECSPRHVPKTIIEVADIPQTKTGKISEFAVKDAIRGRPITNISALANPECLNEYFKNPNLPN